MNDSFGSRLKDKFREEIKHRHSLKMKIFITRAETARTEKLGERNRIATGARMGWRIQEVGMGISRFIKNQGTEISRCKGSCEIQERDGEGRYIVGNFNGKEVLTKIIQEWGDVSLWSVRDTKSIVNVSHAHQRDGTLVSLDDALFQKTHEETSKRWSSLVPIAITLVWR
jgi:hypothetical protein